MDFRNSWFVGTDLLARRSRRHTWYNCGVSRSQLTPHAKPAPSLEPVPHKTKSVDMPCQGVLYIRMYISNITKEAATGLAAQFLNLLNGKSGNVALLATMSVFVTVLADLYDDPRVVQSIADKLISDWQASKDYSRGSSLPN